MKTSRAASVRHTQKLLLWVLFRCMLYSCWRLIDYFWNQTHKSILSNEIKGIGFTRKLTLFFNLVKREVIKRLTNIALALNKVLIFLYL
ncbi:Uncharacterized protein APZ42_004483, partial [Daphnia magna]